MCVWSTEWGSMADPALFPQPAPPLYLAPPPPPPAKLDIYMLPFIQLWRLPQ